MAVVVKGSKDKESKASLIKRGFCLFVDYFYGCGKWA